MNLSNIMLTQVIFRRTLHQILSIFFRENILFLRISYYTLRYIKLQTYPNMVVMLLKHMPFPLEATSLIDVLQGSQILNRSNQTLIIALTINIV